MKKIGLIGGMSWASTAEYYRIINETVSKSLGGLNSAECIIYSVNFQKIYSIQKAGNEKELVETLSSTAKSLEKAGAEFFAICTNTMHKYADIIQGSVSIPIIHIGDATGKTIVAKGLGKVALLGTKYTMEENFYRDRISKNFGIEVIIPDAEQRNFINDVIYNELCLDKILESSKRKFIDIINGLGTLGAEGAVLGCTEIPLLIKNGDTDIPIFDTTLIHANAIAEYALS